MMKKHTWLVLALTLVALAVVGCGSGGSGETALTVSGAVESELSLSMADLEEMGAEEITVEHPKDGEQTYTGVRLNTVVAAAGPTGDTLVAIASDDYSADVDLAEVEACDDCAIAFDDGSLRLVMPGMSSKVWVKNLVTLEVR